MGGMSGRVTLTATCPPVGQLCLFLSPDAEASGDEQPAAASHEPTTPPGDAPPVRALSTRAPAQAFPPGAEVAGGDLAMISDPLVLALAQLVRDRWAADQAPDPGPVAVGPVPSIMARMGQQRAASKATPA